MTTSSEEIADRVAAPLVVRRGLSPFQSRLLSLLEEREQQGLAQMSQPALALALGSTVGSMEITLRKLRRKGYIVVHEPGRGGRNPRPQTYRLTYIPQED